MRIIALYIKNCPISEIAHQYVAFKIFLMMTSGELGQYKGNLSVDAVIAVFQFKTTLICCFNFKHNVGPTGLSNNAWSYHSGKGFMYILVGMIACVVCGWFVCLK